MSNAIGFMVSMIGGLAYGISLLGLGILAGGAGHGTAFALVIAGSPLWLCFPLLPIPWLTIAAWVAIPLFWGIVGCCLGASHRRLPRALFVALLLTHYAALPFALMNADRHGLDRVFWFFVFIMVLYAAGQVAIWTGFYFRLRVAEKKDLVHPIDVLLITVAFLALFATPAYVEYVYMPSQADKRYDFEVADPGHDWTVQLEKAHPAKAAPAFEDGRGQAVSCCAFEDGPTLHCLRPLQFGGEICTWTPKDGKYRCVKIDQPAGVAKGFSSMFDDTGIWVNKKGDQFLRWQLTGNGDHALALRRHGAAQFSTTRVKASLVRSKAICSPDGVWHMVAWNANMARGMEISIHAIDDKLNLSLLGKHHSIGHHDIGVLDAAFVDKDRLHIVWADVELGGKIHSNWLRIRTIDFDLSESRWTNERELWRLDRFVSSVRTAVHVLENGTAHYLWNIDEGQRISGASGIFYHTADAKEPIKIGASLNGFRSVPVGNRIIVAFSQTGEPDKVFFRVIQDGLPGPISSIKIVNKDKQILKRDDMEIGPGVGDAIWFVNLSDVNTIYELKMTQKR